MDLIQQYRHEQRIKKDVPTSKDLTKVNENIKTDSSAATLPERKLIHRTMLITFVIKSIEDKDPYITSIRLSFPYLSVMFSNGTVSF